jgi:hypothetical protein
LVRAISEARGREEKGGRERGIKRTEAQVSVKSEQGGREREERGEERSRGGEREQEARMKSEEMGERKKKSSRIREVRVNGKFNVCTQTIARLRASDREQSKERETREGKEEKRNDYSTSGAT